MAKQRIRGFSESESVELEFDFVDKYQILKRIYNSHCLAFEQAITEDEGNEEPTRMPKVCSGSERYHQENSVK